MYHLIKPAQQLHGVEEVDKSSGVLRGKPAPSAAPGNSVLGGWILEISVLTRTVYILPQTDD